MITPQGDVNEIRKQAFKEGMIPLHISGAQKVAQGLTTMKEIMKVAPPPLGNH